MDSAPVEWGIYARKSKKLSVDDHRREQSTEVQIDMGRRAAADEGAVVREHHIFTDLASAYRDVKRSDFDRALHALAEGEIKVLWCAYLDRFSRKGAEDLLKVIGKRRVIFHSDRLDSMVPGDRRRIIDYAEQAREYSERLSERTVDTKSAQRNAGLWLAQAPYGFEVSKDRKLSHHALLGAVVQRIFQYAAEGYSVRSICRQLNTDRVPASRGGLWAPGTIARIIHNPVYEGWQIVTPNDQRPVAYLNRAGERVRVCEPLVAPELASKARAQLTAGTVDQLGGYGKGKRKHELTGLLRCDGCKRSGCSGGTSYVCANSEACPMPFTAKMSTLEAYVFEKWSDKLMTLDPMDPQGLMVAVVDRWTALQRPEETKATQEAQTKLAAAEKRMDQVMSDRAKGVYDGARERYFFPALEEAEEALNEANAELARLGVAGPVDLTIFTEYHLLAGAYQAADSNLRRALLSLAIRRITVCKGPRGYRFDGPKRVKIEWHRAAPISGQIDIKAA